MTKICNKCGVELDESMTECPLCEKSFHEYCENKTTGNWQSIFQYKRKMNSSQRRFAWEIASIILFTGIISTFIIDFISNKSITWSEYPIAIILVVFSYVSLFAFWRPRASYQITGSFLLSSVLLLVFDFFNGGIRWSVPLVIPILFSFNILLLALIIIYRKSKYKGINLIAYWFMAIAFQCVCIEGIVSYSILSKITLNWSIIVYASIIPIAAVLLFFHFRYKRGRNLKKVFHV